LVACFRGMSLAWTKSPLCFLPVRLFSAPRWLGHSARTPLTRGIGQPFVAKSDASLPVVWLTEPLGCGPIRTNRSRDMLTRSRQLSERLLNRFYAVLALVDTAVLGQMSSGLESLGLLSGSAKLTRPPIPVGTLRRCSLLPARNTPSEFPEDVTVLTH